MTKHAKLLFYFFLILSIQINSQASNFAIYAPLVKEITDAFTREIETEFDLVCIGGGGGMPDDVREIEVDFVAHRRATIEEARFLEISAMEKLLKKINEHEKIRPYLREFPFPPERVSIMISFQKDDASHQSDGTVALVLRGNTHLMGLLPLPFVLLIRFGKTYGLPR